MSHQSKTIKQISYFFIERKNCQKDSFYKIKNKNKRSYTILNIYTIFYYEKRRRSKNCCSNAKRRTKDINSGCLKAC